MQGFTVNKTQNVYSSLCILKNTYILYIAFKYTLLFTSVPVLPETTIAQWVQWSSYVLHVRGIVLRFLSAAYFIFFRKTSRTDVRPKQPATSWSSWILYQVLQLPGREADCSPQLAPKLWMSESVPPQCHILPRSAEGNFSFRPKFSNFLWW